MSTFFSALIFILLIIVTVLCGFLGESLGLSVLRREEYSSSSIFITGFILIAGLSEFLLIPGVLYNASVTAMTICWWAVFLILSLLGIIRFRKDFKPFFNGLFARMKTFAKSGFGGVYGICAYGLIAVQLLGSILLVHYDDDDSFYVASVVSNIKDDHFMRIYTQTGESVDLTCWTSYLVNGWYDFLTVVSKCTGIPGAVLMKTIVPVLMIALTYALYGCFARLIIKERAQRYLFLIFCSLINVFANVSTHTASTILLMRMHQGKAIFANIIVPLVFCIFLRLWNEQKSAGLYAFLFLINTAACFFSTSGLVFGAMLTGIIAVFFAISKKNLKSVLCAAVSVVPNLLFGVIYLAERMWMLWK